MTPIMMWAAMATTTLLTRASPRQAFGSISTDDGTIERWWIPRDLSSSPSA
jgi:hypothetical protein